MNFKILFWSECWPILLLLLASVVDKLIFVLGLPQENEFLRSTKQSTSPPVSTTSIMETKEARTSEISRLIRLEEELSRLSHKLSLQNSKNEEYDRAVGFIKEFKIKQTESESSQKREIEALKGVVSRVESKEETRDDEMKKLKGRVDQIESQISENQQSNILKRQNLTTSKPNNITTPLPCSFKTPCVYDFKNVSSAASSNKMTASTSLPALNNISKATYFTTSSPKPNITAGRSPCIPTIPCAFDFKDVSISAASNEKINATKPNNVTTSKPNITARFPLTNNTSFGRVDYTDASLRAASSDKKDFISSSLSALKNISKPGKPPSSCKELSTDGHTLNGIYLLYDSIFNKVFATFCDFSNSNKGAHQQLGFVNVKSLPEGVYFYAQRSLPFLEHNVIIPFDRILINEGGGLNEKTGIFTAPKTGVYRFWFNCKKTGIEAPLHIDLRVNGANVANAYGHHTWTPVSFHSVVKLKTGDEVHLFLFGDGEIYDDNTPDTQFSGWLVDEELIFSQK